MITAEKLDAKYALMVVHSYSGSNEWFGDFEAFFSLFGVEAKPNRVHQVDVKRGRVTLSLARIEGNR